MIAKDVLEYLMEQYGVFIRFDLPTKEFKDARKQAIEKFTATIQELMDCHYQENW